MRVYITASSGVGKTTITDELARRGFDAYDTDEVPGLARLELQATKEPVEWPKSGFVDWKKYGWNIEPAVLDRLLAKHKKLFLSGVCGNQDEFYDKFDRLIVLTTNPEKHLHRMRNREYRGVNDDEINVMKRLEKYPAMLQSFIDTGFTPVDNSGTPAQTVNKILEIIHDN